MQPVLDRLWFQLLGYNRPRNLHWGEPTESLLLEVVKSTLDRGIAWAIKKNIRIGVFQSVLHYVYINYAVLYPMTQLSTSSLIGPPLYHLLNHLLTMRAQLIKIKIEGNLNYMGLFDLFFSLRHKVRNTIQLRLIDFQLWELVYAFRSHSCVVLNVWSLRFGLWASLWFSSIPCISIVLPALTELVLESNAFNQLKLLFIRQFIIVHLLDACGSYQAYNAEM